MKLTAALARSLQADLQAELRDIERAAATGTRDAGRGLMTELRRQVGSAGLGQRLANSWSDRHYPRWRPEPSRRAPRPDLVAPERPEGVPVVRDVGEREARILEQAGPDVEVVAS